MRESSCCGAQSGRRGENAAQAEWQRQSGDDSKRTEQRFQSGMKHDPWQVPVRVPYRLPWESGTKERVEFGCQRFQSERTEGRTEEGLKLSPRTYQYRDGLSDSSGRESV